MTKLSLCFLFIAFFVFSSCSHSVHQVHVGDFSHGFKSLKEGKMISAESEQFVIMGFVMDTDYVDQAYQNLLGQCPKKNIQSVSTNFSTSHGFFSWTNRIKMQALCY
jgi:hypothetical protein